MWGSLSGFVISPGRIQELIPFALLFYHSRIHHNGHSQHNKEYDHKSVHTPYKRKTMPFPEKRHS